MLPTPGKAPRMGWTGAGRVGRGAGWRGLDLEVETHCRLAVACSQIEIDEHAGLALEHAAPFAAGETGAQCSTRVAGPAVLEVRTVAQAANGAAEDRR